MLHTFFPIFNLSPVRVLCRVLLFVTPWIVALQDPLVLVHGSSQARILEWVAISPLDLPEPGIEPLFPVSSAVKVVSLPAESLESLTLPLFSL